LNQGWAKNAFQRIVALNFLSLENIHIQQVVTARRGNEVGHGVLEQMHIGPWAPAGFTDWFDG